MEENTNISWIKLIQDAGLEQQFIEAANERSAKPTEENAKIFYEKVCKGGELSDEELDNVAGGCGSESLKEALECERRLKLAEKGTCVNCGTYTMRLADINRVPVLWKCRNCGLCINSITGCIEKE